MVWFYLIISIDYMDFFSKKGKSFSPPLDHHEVTVRIFGIENQEHTEIDNRFQTPMSMKALTSYLSLGIIFLFLSFSVIAAGAVTISGKVKTFDQETAEVVLVAGARVSALDLEDHVTDWDICNEEGEFSLDVPESIDLHILMHGPIGSDEYVDTYTPFFDSGTEDIEDMEGQIVGKYELEAILALDNPPVDQRKGIVMGVVEAQVYSREGISDLVPVAGSRVSIMDSDGNNIDAPIVYMDENGDWDPSLQETSLDGRYVVYNVDIRRIGEIEAEDVSLAARKQLSFFPLSQARLYPNTSQGGRARAQVLCSRKR